VALTARHRALLNEAWRARGGRARVAESLLHYDAERTEVEPVSDAIEDP